MPIVDILPATRIVDLPPVDRWKGGGPIAMATWPFRKRIDIQTANLDANLTDFPLYVRINSDADIGAQCLANGHDLRFAASDGVTELPYEREFFGLTNQIPDNLDTDVSHITTDGVATISDSYDYSRHGGASVKYVWISGVTKNIYFYGGGAGFGNAGKEFTFSVYVRKADGSPVTGLGSYIYQVGDNQALSPTITDAGDGWYRVTISHAFPNSAKIWLVGLYNLPSDQAIYLDNWKVEAGLAATGTGDWGEVSGDFWVKSNVSTAGTHIYIYYGNAGASDGADPENVWDASFKAVYHMNDATTSTILDSTANNNDGTKKAANEPIEADGKIGKGQNYDGANDYIETSSAITADLYTIEFWVNRSGASTGNPRLATPEDTHWILWAPGNGIGFYGAIYSAGDPPLGVWTFYSIVFNRATGAVTIYQNALTPVTGTATKSSPTQKWVIGDSGDKGTSDVWPGGMDEVRISTSLRSAAWVKFEYHNMAEADNELTWGGAGGLYQ